MQRQELLFGLVVKMPASITEGLGLSPSSAPYSTSYRHTPGAAGEDGSSGRISAIMSKTRIDVGSA